MEHTHLLRHRVPQLVAYLLEQGYHIKNLDHVLGIVKAYTTRVGEGPFPTELFDKTGKFYHLEDMNSVQPQEEPEDVDG